VRSTHHNHYHPHLPAALRFITHPPTPPTNQPKSQGHTGAVEAYYDADLLLLSADPLASPDVLSDPSKHVRLVIKEGLVVAAPAACAALGGINDMLFDVPAGGGKAASA
jgi:hypothetical protein